MLLLPPAWCQALTPRRLPPLTPAPPLLPQLLGGKVSITWHPRHSRGKGGSNHLPENHLSRGASLSLSRASQGLSSRASTLSRGSLALQNGTVASTLTRSHGGNAGGASSHSGTLQGTLRSASYAGGATLPVRGSTRSQRSSANHHYANGRATGAHVADADEVLWDACGRQRFLIVLKSNKLEEL